ncbi:MAG: hypothetical protein NZM04_04725, partial [Methylacidiphilales bacterium]|nr:hypothetical protein [Candidatus Methylacidiphilales bacterium]
LFRVLLTMFGLLALVSLVGFAWALWCRPAHWLTFALWVLVFVTATLIAYCRCKKRSEDFAQSVYDLFIAGNTGKLATPKEIKVVGEAGG